jgi:hypothetical protein
MNDEWMSNCKVADILFDYSSEIGFALTK